MAEEKSKQNNKTIEEKKVRGQVITRTLRKEKKEIKAEEEEEEEEEEKCKSRLLLRKW